MSAKLARAMATGKVIVRKKVTGEVMIIFRSDQDSIILEGRKATNLMDRGITLEDIRHSNIRGLLGRGMIDVVL